ncbi:MAG: hypothetical protein KJO34_09730, partial [Deltaproteobacteria bacterium]|nr:hypothetical protein [Deltaproteobacteria bacterium]
MPCIEPKCIVTYNLWNFENLAAALHLRSKSNLFAVAAMARPVSKIMGLIVLTIGLASTHMVLAGDLDSYEFSASWDSFPPDPIAIDRVLSDWKAVSIDDDRFVSETGKDVRAWGVAIQTLNELLQAPVADKRKLIARLRSLGFNQIQFVGLDFDDPGIYRDWKKDRELPAEKLAQYCELIEAARSEGMVYTVALNQITDKYLPDSRSGPNKSPKKLKRLKGVQLFEPSILAATKEWFATILTSELPGCRYALANDPGLMYLNIVNEDSLFIYYGNGYKTFSKENINYLSDMFSNYLVGKFGGIESTARILFPRQSEQREKMLLSKSVGLCRAAEQSIYPRWCSETMEFFTELEKEYFLGLKKTIRSAGYKGPITTTNNWYGSRNAKLNVLYGDATNIHVYFDPPRRIKLPLGSAYRLLNQSFVRSGFNTNYEQARQLYRLPSSIYEKRPAIISEWNHGIWSDYVYEGPILLTLAGVTQDVSVMTIHSYLPRRESYKSSYSSMGLSVIGNPTLTAMLPTLARAFLLPNDSRNMPAKATRFSLSTQRRETAYKPDRLAFKAYESVVNSGQLFTTKFRQSLGDDSRRESKKSRSITAPELSWQRNGEHSTLVADLGNTVMFAGDTRSWTALSDD